jgi:site-specific DNA recombinase
VTLRVLTAEAEKLGLRNRNGNPLPLALIHKMLRNAFYAGVLRSSRFGAFPSAHVPLVTKATFDRVQAVLAGKFIRRTKRHLLRFLRLLHCKTCGRSLIGSERKGFVYYRCSNIPCPTTSVREDRVDEAIYEVLASIRMEESEAKAIEAELAEHDRKRIELQDARLASLTDALSALNARLTRLTDLLIDGKIDATVHEAKRTELLLEQKQLEGDLADVEAGTATILEKARQIVGLAQSAENLYQSGDDKQKRRLLQTVLSNCTVIGKSLAFALREPFAALAKRTCEQSSAPDWYTARTFG